MDAGSIEDAHKLAMAQVQFAQSVIRQLEKQVAMLERASTQSQSAPAVELKGK